MELLKEKDEIEILEELDCVNSRGDEVRLTTDDLFYIKKVDKKNKVYTAFHYAGLFPSVTHKFKFDDYGKTFKLYDGAPASGNNVDLGTILFNAFFK